MKTTVIIGKNCVAENKDAFLNTGKKAAIITGKRSAVLSGAQKDVIDTLKNIDSTYVLVDKVENNPSTENIREITKILKDEDIDHIIAIGGGSPIDAAKAVALLYTNDNEPKELYNNKLKNDPLPLIAIPTTAGTGSEVTPYSVLTIEEKETKMGFVDDRLFPKYAFLDHRYTMSLSKEITIDTALDAFSHAFEGYISTRRTKTADIIAIESMKIFFEVYPNLYEYDMTEETREKLLYSSMLAGIVISQTGTTVLHSMGYALTYNKNIAHGRANGLLFYNYFVELLEENSKRLEELAAALNLKNEMELAEKISKLFSDKLDLDDFELIKYSKDTLKQKSIKFTPIKLNFDKILKIYKNS